MRAWVPGLRNLLEFQHVYAMQSVRQHCKTGHTNSHQPFLTINTRISTMTNHSLFSPRKQRSVTLLQESSFSLQEWLVIK